MSPSNRKPTDSRTVFFLIVLLIVQLFFLAPLFHPGIYISHDGENHLARFAAYYKAFVDHQFPPRWAEDLNYGYGSPVFIFFYPLPGYIASAIHALGVPFQATYKIIIGLCFILTPMFSFVWLSRLVKKEAAFGASIFMGIAPYQILNLLVRGDIAEMMATMFLFLTFYALEHLLQNATAKHVLYGCLAYGLMILSHNGVSLMFTPVLLLYIWFRSNQLRKPLLSPFLMILGGLGLSGFFWIPALIESRFTLANTFIGSMYKDQFPTIQQLIWSSWGFGADVAKSGGLSPQIGPLQIIFIVAAIITSIRTVVFRRMTIYWTILFLLGIFISLPLSSPLWQHLTILQKYEFPWRFVLLPTIAGSVIIAYFFATKKTSFIILSSIILILLSLPNIKVQGYTNKPDAFYVSFPGSTYYHGETTTIWSAGDPGTYPKTQVDVIAGKAKVSNVIKNSFRQSFTVRSEAKSKILLNTYYFPGWTVIVNGKKASLEFQDTNHRGLITFDVPQGTSKIIAQFKESAVRRIADAITVITLIILCVTLLVPVKLKT